MKSAKIKAAMCVAACPLYMFSAELFAQLDMRLGVVFAVVMGMLSAAASFLCGREDEFAKQMKAHADEATWMCFATGMENIVCGNCGCREFSMTAGRLVCLCCGSVLEKEADLRGKETEA